MSSVKDHWQGDERGSPFCRMILKSSVMDMVVGWRDESELDEWISVCRGSAVRSRHRRDMENT